MDSIIVTYKLYFDKEKPEIFTFELDPKSLEVRPRPSWVKPDWTQLTYHQCKHCPLTKNQCSHCPVAVNLAQVIDRLGTVLSHQQIKIEVVTDERIVTQDTTVQRAVSSLVGFLIATSGCPHTTFLKPMARFHLPFASLEETIYRSTSMYLLAQYFLNKEKMDLDLELKGLKAKYKDMHELNSAVADRMKDAIRTDSPVNAVVVLDTFALTLPYAIEDSLEEIRYLFQSYLE